MLLLKIVPLLLSSSTLLLVTASEESEESFQHHFNSATTQFSSGQMEEALASFDKAIELDPTHPTSYFQRATVKVRLGRSSAAHKDFSKVIELQPEFEQAYFERAKISAKGGHVDDALKDLKFYLEKHGEDSEARELLQEVQQASQTLDSGNKALESGDYQAGIKSFTDVILTMPHVATLRLKRAQCHLGKLDLDNAISDLMKASKLDPSFIQPYLQLANIFIYVQNNRDRGIGYIRQCIHSDPEQKECKALFRKVKNLNKEIENIKWLKESKQWRKLVRAVDGDEGLLKSVDDALSLAFGKHNLVSTLKHELLVLKCRAQLKLKEHDKAIETCGSVIAENKSNLEAFFYRGEAYLQTDEYDDAKSDFQQASKLDPDNSKIKTKLSKLERLRTKKDYYKILKVPRTATKDEIKKAYRKRAKEYHPDRYQGTKEDAQKKMADVNQAWEVLQDDEKRRQFDNGQDPFDPSGGQGGHHGHGGGNPFFFQQGSADPFFHFFQQGKPGGDGGFFQQRTEYHYSY